MFPKVALIPTIWVASVTAEQHFSCMHWFTDCSGLTEEATYCSCTELSPGSFQWPPLCCHHPACEAAEGIETHPAFSSSLALSMTFSCHQKEKRLHLIDDQQPQVLQPAAFYQRVDQAVGLLYRSHVQGSLVSPLHRWKPSLAASIFFHHEV